MKHKRPNYKKKSKMSLNIFLYKLDVILFRFLAKFSSKNRERKKKRRKESLKLFLHKLDRILFRFISWFSAKNRYLRAKRRKEFFRYINFRLKTQLQKIAYWNSKEIREIRKKNRKKYLNFIWEKNKFFFQLYVYRIYKSIIDIKKWLKNELESSDKKKIVFIHQPLYSSRISLKGASEVRVILSQNNVVAVFSGHTEEFLHINLNGVEYFTIPGMAKNSAYPASFAEITVNSSGISTKLYYKSGENKIYKARLIK